VKLFGEPLTPATGDRLRQRIGVQTDTNLYELLSVHDNLAVWADLFGIPKARQAGRISEVLEIFDLGDRRQSPVGTLSKGMRQKLAVGRAILHEPELLFLDEPTSGLDPEASEELIAYLRTLIDQSRTTVVICTHQLYGLERLCTEVGFLERGHLKLSGKVDDLIARAWPMARFSIDVAGQVEPAIALLAGRVALAEAISGGDVAIELAKGEEIVAVVRHLVEAGIPIRSVIPVTRTIHDLYFDTIVAESRAA
jgi:ABC-2 type transport system ATP-binding protein